MPISNDTIAHHVKVLTDNYTKTTKLKPDDEFVIKAIQVLFTNVLQNLNDIAEQVRVRDSG